MESPDPKLPSENEPLNVSSDEATQPVEAPPVDWNAHVSTPKEYLRNTTPALIPMSEKDVFRRGIKLALAITAVLITAVVLGLYLSNRAAEPKKARAAFAAGETLVKVGRYRDAIPMLNQMLQYDPNDPEALRLRGISYSNNNDDENAVKDFTAFLKLQPNGIDTYFDRGIVYGRMHKSQEAIADFSRYIAAKPRAGRAFNYRGAAYRELKQYPQALDNFSQAIGLEHETDEILDDYYQRGAMYEALGDLPHAMADYNKAIEISPERPFVYISRGTLRKRLGDNNAGDADLKLAKSIEDRIFQR